MDSCIVIRSEARLRRRLALRAVPAPLSFYLHKYGGDGLHRSMALSGPIAVTIPVEFAGFPVFSNFDSIFMDDSSRPEPQP